MSTGHFKGCNTTKHSPHKHNHHHQPRYEEEEEAESESGSSNGSGGYKKYREKDRGLQGCTETHVPCDAKKIVRLEDTKIYRKRYGDFRELAGISRMPTAGKVETIRLIVDSRDRSLDAYPSANSFSWQMSSKPKLIKTVELASACVPLLAGCTERYVIITEDHCEDAIQSPSSIMFGMDAGATACEYPKGMIGMIPLNKQIGTTTNDYVWWQNGKLGIIWPCLTLQGNNSSFDRLNIRFWIWSSTHSAIPYPLPIEAGPVPAVANNVVLVFILTHET